MYLVAAITLSIVLSLYLVICIIIYVIQKKLLFKNTVIPKDQRLDYSDYFEELYLNPEGDIKLHALYFPAKNPKGIVFYLHGTRGHLAKSGSVAPMFLTRDFSVFMYDYRSYGKSNGSPTQVNMYSDALMAFDFVMNQYAPERIVVYGHSLGTGIASYLASQRAANATILDAPYLSVKHEAQRRYSVLPMGLLIKYPFRNDLWLTQKKNPIYIIHGSNDEEIPVSSGLTLSKIAQCECIVVSDGEHNNLRYFEAHKQLLDRVLT